MYKKIMGLMLSVVLGTALLAGCGKPEAEAPKEEAAVNEETTEEETGQTETDGEKPKLVYIAGDMSNESQVFASARCGSERA